MDWIAANDRMKSKAKHNFTNTDYHQDQIDLKEPEF